jgi:hypothetical protein
LSLRPIFYHKYRILEAIYLFFQIKSLQFLIFSILWAFWKVFPAGQSSLRQVKGSKCKGELPRKDTKVAKGEGTVGGVSVLRFFGGRSFGLYFFPVANHSPLKTLKWVCAGAKKEAFLALNSLTNNH